MAKKILVVDNHPVILKYMTNLLGKKGYQVKTAEDGLSALDILMTYIPDVMFIDLVMPNINGGQLCRIIRKMPALKDAYAVILSATMAEQSRDFTELGANAFIVKGPFNQMAKHVLAAIEQSDRDIPMGAPEEIMEFNGVYKREITKELISAKGHLEEILRNISDAIIELAPEGRIIFANPAAASLMGLPEEELLGSKFIELINEGDRQRIEAFLIRIDEDSHKVDLDTPVLINNRQISLSMLPVKEDVSPSVMLVLNDITDAMQAEAILKREHNELEMQVKVRTMELSKANEALRLKIAVSKQAEEALRESEEKYRQLAETAREIIVTLDLDGRITYVNSSGLKMAGLEKAEVLKMHISDFLPQEVIPLMNERLAKRAMGSQEELYLQLDVTIMEQSVPIELSGTLIKKDGKPSGILIVARDISEKKQNEDERKKLENRLQRAQKMGAIGTLAGGVAHDLNNILGGLVSYPELLLLQLPENSPLRKSIQTIQKSGEKVAAVVQDLLTLARRGVVVSEVVNLNRVISEYLKSPEHEKLQSYHPGIQIETNLEKDTLNILGSSTHLSKTVMNLVSNAAEAMPEGGNLIVSTENRYIDRPITGYDDVKQGDYVVLTVSDTGTGISPDDMEKIFEPFYTKKKMGRSGTGLGMAVVWGTVKDHKGYIDVQSTEGKGTTFTLYFPVTRKKPA